MCISYTKNFTKTRVNDIFICSLKNKSKYGIQHQTKLLGRRNKMFTFGNLVLVVVVLFFLNEVILFIRKKMGWVKDEQKIKCLNLKLTKCEECYDYYGPSSPNYHKYWFMIVNTKEYDNYGNEYCYDPINKKVWVRCDEGDWFNLNPRHCVIFLIQRHPHSHNHKKCVDNPKSHYDFFFTPSAEFKVVVEWCHFENSFAK